MSEYLLHCDQYLLLQLHREAQADTPHGVVSAGVFRFLRMRSTSLPSASNQSMASVELNENIPDKAACCVLKEAPVLQDLLHAGTRGSGADSACARHILS